LKKHHKLLDFGCNQGLFLSFLNQLGYENVFGYDPYVSKYSERKILSKKYDFITTYDVIEHVDEPRDFLTQLVSCLEKGGLLILGTPNADEIKLSRPESPELHQPYHRHILSEKALMNLAFSKGLEVVVFYKRAYWDTLYPMVNTRFLWTYVHQTENVIDVLGEPLRWQLLLTSPLLIFYSFADYFFRMPGNMTVRRRIYILGFENYGT
jgi:SAM-dependent methyltransferase